jgi:hypothetical protein
MPDAMVRGSSPGHPAFVDQFSWGVSAGATDPATSQGDGDGRRTGDCQRTTSGEGHGQEQDGVMRQSPRGHVTPSGSRGAGRPEADSPRATTGIGGLPPGLEATPDQSEDGHDQSVAGLTSRVCPFPSDFERALNTSLSPCTHVIPQHNRYPQNNRCCMGPCPCSTCVVLWETQLQIWETRRNGA